MADGGTYFAIVAWSRRVAMAAWMASAWRGWRAGTKFSGRAKARPYLLLARRAAQSRPYHMSQAYPGAIRGQQPGQ